MINISHNYTLGTLAGLEDHLIRSIILTKGKKTYAGPYVAGRLTKLCIKRSKYTRSKGNNAKYNSGSYQVVIDF